MHNPVLIPKTINSYRVTFTDNLMQTNNTYYFGSLEEASETMKHIDLERYSVTIRKVLFGDEYISEWDEPKQGQYYKMTMIRRDAICCSKSFFLCKNPTLPPFWYMVLIYVQPTGISVEIRAIDSNGALAKGEPIISTTLPATKERLNDIAKNNILDWYIVRFVEIHSPNDPDIEWAMKSGEKQKAELNEGKDILHEISEVFDGPPESYCQDCKH